MASPIPPMLIELQLETAKIQAQMANLTSEFRSFGQTVEKQSSFLSNFKATAAGVFAGNLMQSGLMAIKAGITGAIKDAQEYEQTLAKTSAVIKSTGNVAGLSVEGLKAQASALEQLSGTIDEKVILSGENVLATFTQIRNAAGAGNDIFNQTTKAALDLSVAMGQDMQSSVVQLGKALNDPIKGVTALQRVGVTFDAQQKAMIKTMMNAGDVMGAQKIILQEVNREFGGAAKAAGDTFAGAVGRLKDKFEDFGRNLVTNIQPILLNIGKAIASVIDVMKPMFDFIVKNKDAFIIFGGVLVTALGVFKAYQGVLKLVTIAQAAYNAVLAANPITLIVIGVAALAAAFVYLWNKFEGFRSAIVKGLQVILNAVGYLVGGVGTLINAMSKIPGLGSKFKGVGDAINAAANNVRTFANNLDNLKDKKISVSLGGTKTAADFMAGAANGAAVPTATTAEKIKNAAAAAKKAAKDLVSANDEVKKIYADMNKVIADSLDKRNSLIKDKNDKDAADRKSYADTVFKIDRTFQEASTKALTSYNEKVAQLRKDANDKAVQLELDATQKRIDVIQKSKDLLINAFAQGTGVDLANLFKDSDQTGAGLVQKMKDKLAAVMQLQANAGKLASQGFSQQFIQDVVSQGPEAGNAMASAILSATPDTVSEMKALYGKIQSVSETGLNSLADQMSTGTSLATRQLTAEYNQIGVDLQKLLAQNQGNLNDALVSEKKSYDDAIASAMQTQRDAMADAQKTLQNALAQNAKDYNDAIDTLNKDTIDKLKTLQDQLQLTADKIKALAGANAAVQALANSPAAPYIAGVTPIGTTPTYTRTGMGENAGNMGKIVINQKIDSNGTDTAAITQATVSAIKFGTNASLSGTSARGD